MGPFLINDILNIEGVFLTSLKMIDVPGGDVLHAIKESDNGYSGFGEAYFSTVRSGAIKAWKLHNKMILNLVVPVGSIRFVIYDSREDSKSSGRFGEVILSRKNYCRLTIPPLIWIGFQGVDANESVLLNVANIPHDPDEENRKSLGSIKYDWELI